MDSDSGIIGAVGGTFALLASSNRGERRAAAHGPRAALPGRRTGGVHYPNQPWSVQYCARTAVERQRHAELRRAQDSHAEAAREEHVGALSVDALGDVTNMANHRQRRRARAVVFESRPRGGQGTPPARRSASRQGTTMLDPADGAFQARTLGVRVGREEECRERLASRMAQAKRARR